MKIKEAYEQFGGKDELVSLCDTIAKTHGIIVTADEVVDEENPSDNYLCIYFEYRDKDAPNFASAADAVLTALEKRGLTMNYECNGDGSVGIIRTYRVGYLCA